MIFGRVTSKFRALSGRSVKTRFKAIFEKVFFSACGEKLDFCPWRETKCEAYVFYIISDILFIMWIYIYIGLKSIMIYIIYIHLYREIT